MWSFEPSFGIGSPLMDLLDEVFEAPLKCRRRGCRNWRMEDSFCSMRCRQIQKAFDARDELVKARRELLRKDMERLKDHLDEGASSTGCQRPDCRRRIRLFQRSESRRRGDYCSSKCGRHHIRELMVSLPPPPSLEEIIRITLSRNNHEDEVDDDDHQSDSDTEIHIQSSSSSSSSSFSIKTVSSHHSSYSFSQRSSITSISSGRMSSSSSLLLHEIMSLDHGS